MNSDMTLGNSGPVRTGIGSRFSNWIKTPGFQRYFKNTGWLLVGRVVTLVVSFFATTYIARRLGPTNYGQLSYAISFTGIFSFIYSLGIDQVLYRDLVKYPEKRNVYLGTAFWMRAVAGILATIICITIALLTSERDISLTLICVIASTFLFNAFNVVNYEFQANVQSKQLSIIGIIGSLTLNGLKVLAIFFGKGALYLAIIFAFEAVLYAGLYILYRTRSYGSVLNWKFDKRAAMSMLQDSWPILFAGAFALIYVRIDQVMIKNLIDTASVGLYDAAVRIAEVWYFIPAAIASSLFPAIVNSKMVSEKIYRKRLAALIATLGGLACIVALPVALLAPFIMKLLFGPAFVAGSTVLQIYIWGGLGTSLGLVANFYLVTENKRVLMLTTSLITMLANVGLNLWFIPRYGINGSAWATFISYMLLGLPLLLLLRKSKMNVNPPQDTAVNVVVDSSNQPEVVPVLES